LCCHDPSAASSLLLSRFDCLSCAQCNGDKLAWTRIHAHNSKLNFGRVGLQRRTSFNFVAHFP
jgi:hypothetical protein